MQFDLVSPERRLASGQARSIRIPGADGDLTAMPSHAPLITTLRPGILTVTGSDGVESFAVTGGFAEISPESVSVLAERAYPRASQHKGAIEAHLDEARKAAEAATPEDRDAAEKIVADMVRLLEDMA